MLTEIVRTYSPRELRQQRNDLLVYTAREIRTALTIAANRSHAVSMRLGADIILDDTIVVPSAVPQFHLTGSDNFGFFYKEDLTSAISIEGTDTEVLLTDLSFQASTGSASILISCSTSLDGLRMRNIQVSDTTDLLDPDKHWTRVSVIDGRLAVGATPINIRNTRDVGAIILSNFTDLQGNISITVERGSGGFVASNVGSSLNTGSLDTTQCNAATSNMFSCCNFASISLRSSDGFTGENYMTVSPRGMVSTPVSAFPTGADQTITVSNASYIRLDSSATGNFTLSDGLLSGQLLVIECVANSGGATLPDNVVNRTNLSAAWTPGVGDTISLIWNGTVWSELAQANN